MTLFDQAKEITNADFHKTDVDIRRILIRVGIKITRADTDESEATEDLSSLFDDPLDGLCWV